MQKAVTFLEKNVEWFALGLAGVWVLYVVWAFVIAKPAAVEIGGETLTAASVDEVIAQGPAQDLRTRISANPHVDFPVPPIELVFDLPVPPGNFHLPIESQPYRPAGDTALAGRNDPSTPGVRTAAGKVERLPELPNARIIEVVADKGQIIPPQLNNNLNPGGGGFGPNGEPIPAPLLPPQPAQNVNPNVPVQQVVGVDKWWTWVAGKFDEGAVRKAFEDAKIPRHLANPEYLAVEVQREELLPNGQWGNPRLIPPLPMNAPPPGAEREKSAPDYLMWALQPQNQLIILEPPFYSTVTPERKIPVHLRPRVIQPEVPLIQMAQDLATIAQQWEEMTPTERNRIIERLTPEQRQELTRLRQEVEAQKRQQNAQQRQQQNTSRTRERYDRGGIRGGGSAPIDPELLGEMLASGGSTFDRGSYRPVRDPMLGRGGMENFRGQPFIPNNPGQLNVVMPGGIQQPNGTITYGEFDVWAFDETVEPGKSYRYRMRVVVKNPIYRTNFAANPQLAQVLELPADKEKGWSNWSRPVLVERGVEFFLAGASKDTVRVEIFRWQDGKMNKFQTQATAGDVIGTIDPKTKLDFTTGYTIVEARQIGSDIRVTLLDPSGNQTVRYLNADRNNPKRQTLDADATRPTNPTLSDIRS